MNISQAIKSISNPVKIGILLIVAGVAFFLLKKTTSSQSSQTQYETAPVTKGTLLKTVSESGNITSSSQAGVGSPTTGIIQEIYVKDGDAVKQGQKLFKVASTATAQERASALATYLSTKTQLTAAQAGLFSLQSTMFAKWKTYTDIAQSSSYQNSDLTPNTTNRVLTPFTIAQDDWLSAEALYKNQQNAIAQSQASATAASLAYGATQNAVVTAPITGTVANLTVRPGDQITASGGNLSSTITSTTTSTNAVLYIGNYSTPYIKVQAGEVDAPNIHAGQKATVTLDAFPGKTFVGTVDQVDTSGAITSGVVTYNVFVTFVVPPAHVLPGMSASVVIQTARKDDALIVPSSAVDASSGQPTVRVMKKGVVSSVPVEVGMSSDTDTEILSGLSENDVVVTGVVSPTKTQSTGTSPFGRSVGGFGGAGGGVRIGGGGRGG